MGHFRAGNLGFGSPFLAQEHCLVRRSLVGCASWGAAGESLCLEVLLGARCGSGTSPGHCFPGECNVTASLGTILHRAQPAPEPGLASVSQGGQEPCGCLREMRHSPSGYQSTDGAGVEEPRPAPGRVLREKAPVEPPEVAPGCRICTHPPHCPGQASGCGFAPAAVPAPFQLHQLPGSRRGQWDTSHRHVPLHGVMERPDSAQGTPASPLPGCGGGRDDGAGWRDPAAGLRYSGNPRWSNWAVLVGTGV